MACAFDLECWGKSNIVKFHLLGCQAIEVTPNQSACVPGFQVGFIVPWYRERQKWKQITDSGVKLLDIGA